MPRRPTSRRPSGGRASRSAWRTYEPPADLLRTPARLAPRADARELGLRDQRRRLLGRGVANASSSSPPATRASRLAQRRSGSASTGTSNERSSMAPGGRGLRGALRPGRPLAPRQARAAARTIGGAQLVYSDARIVSPDGELVRPSYWTERRNNYTNFGSLLLANSVTGAASMFRRELLDDALPFPPRSPRAFHDHWLRRGRDGTRRDRLRRRAALRLRPARRRGDRALGGEQATAADPAASGRAAPQSDRRLARRLLLRLAPAAALRRGAAAALLGPDDGAEAPHPRRGCSRPTAGSPAWPGCWAAARGRSGATTRRSTGSSSTRTPWCADEPSRATPPARQAKPLLPRDISIPPDADRQPAI